MKYFECAHFVWGDVIVMNPKYRFWRSVAKAMGFDVPSAHKTHQTDLQGLAVELGIYPSRSRATKEGISGPIPYGYNRIKLASKAVFDVYRPVPKGMEL